MKFKYSLRVETHFQHEVFGFLSILRFEEQTGRLPCAEHQLQLGLEEFLLHGQVEVVLDVPLDEGVVAEILDGCGCEISE